MFTDRVRHTDVNLRPIERPLALVHEVLPPNLGQGLCQRPRRLLPSLVAAHRGALPLRPGAEVHLVVVEAEGPQEALRDLEHADDLVTRLGWRAVDVRVILSRFQTGYSQICPVMCRSSVGMFGPV